jgi:hypothetical protein
MGDKHSKHHPVMATLIRQIRENKVLKELIGDIWGIKFYDGIHNVQTKQAMLAANSSSKRVFL